MKKAFYTIVSLIIITSTGYMVAGANLEFFRGRNENDQIFLEWQVGSGNNNFSKFAIERKEANENSFIAIDYIPRGEDNYYTYYDKNVFKTNSRVFIYRLVIYNSDNYVDGHSAELTVSYSPTSGVFKNTWGSIKAMFR